MISSKYLLQWEEQFRFLGIKIINVSDFSELLIRLALNLLVIFTIVQFIYLRHSSRKEFYFSFFSVAMVVFLLSFLLNNVKLELGFAFGLFAIFGIIRYRTTTIPIKEMTYLFVVIGVSVINALANKKVSYTELIFTNAVIIFGLWLLEKRLMLSQLETSVEANNSAVNPVTDLSSIKENSIKLIYEKMENLHPGKEEILLADLHKRTGININHFKIKKINLQEQNAEITLFYHENENASN